MKEKIDIEQLVRSKLDEAELAPSKGTWGRIRRQYLWQNFLQFKPWQLNIYTLGGMLMIGAGSLFLSSLPQDRDVEHDMASARKTINNEMGVKEKRMPGHSYEQAGNIVKPNEIEEQTSTSASTPNLTAENAIQGTSPSESDLVEINPSNRQNQQIAESLQSTEDIAILPPRAFFTPSVTSGCAPLNITFINQCENADVVKWLFDDLATSMDKNPVFTFTDPGQYDITVIAVNKEGWAKRYLETIEVYPTPVADFEFSDPMETVDGSMESTLLNYSTGASSYSWIKPSPSIKWSSGEFQPLLASTSVGEGEGSIQLVVTNESGCSDTVIKKIPEELLSSLPDLKFPSAFSPSPSGSIGGSYSPNEKRTDIFHPVFVEAPAEYHLRIYTRRGELVFQTDNIYIGWDGYYLQEQSATDVYVWVAEGKWSNGKEFMLRGDVTLLWNGYQ